MYTVYCTLYTVYCTLHTAHGIPIVQTVQYPSVFGMIKINMFVSVWNYKGAFLMAEPKIYDLNGSFKEIVNVSHLIRSLILKH